MRKQLAIALTSVWTVFLLSCDNSVEYKAIAYSAYFNMGFACAERGDDDLAIEAYQKAIAINPDVDTHYNLGYGPDGLGAAQFNLGIAYSVQIMNHIHQEYDLAIESYLKAIAIKPNFAKAHYFLASVYLLKNEKNLSLGSLQKAITLDKSYIEKAKTDPNFDNIRKSPEFQRLINSRQTSGVLKGPRRQALEAGKPRKTNELINSSDSAKVFNDKANNKRKIVVSSDNGSIDPGYFYLSFPKNGGPSNSNVFSVSSEPIYCHVRVINCQDSTIIFYWDHQGSSYSHTYRSKRIPQTGNRWRTNAEKSFHGRTGNWTVSIYRDTRDKANLLGSIAFLVVE